ncbi:hypothetical protein D1872_232390 [compost metagenome]
MLVARLFMQRAADPMSQKIADHGIPVRFRVLLDGRGNIPEPIARDRLRNAQVQAFLGDLEQALHGWAGLADRIAPAGVAEPAAVFRHDVQLKQIPFLQRFGGRKPMRHHIVDRSASFRGESVVAFGKLLAAQFHDVLGDKIVDLERGDAGLDQFGDLSVAIGHDLARRFHLFDFPG